MLACIALIQLYVGGFDGEFPPVGHGVSGVYRQVHEDLVDLSGIGLDGPEILFEHLYKFDVLFDNAVQHFLQIAYHLQGTLRFSADHVAFYKSWQVVRELVCPLAYLLYRGDVLEYKVDDRAWKG